jgi:hypothetical protein
MTWLHGIGYAFSIYFGGRASIPIAAVVYILLYKIIDYNGIVRKLFIDVIPLHLLLKAFFWIFASSGALTGYILYVFITGAPSSQFDYYVIFISAAIEIMNNFKRSSYFDNYAPVHSIPLSPVWDSWLKPEAESFSRAENLRKKAIFQTYIDFNIVALLSLLACFSLIIVSGGPIGLFAPKNYSPDLWNSFVFSMSFLNITEKIVDPYDGTAWAICKALISFLLMLYLVLFISIGASLIEEPPAQADAKPADPVAANGGNESAEAT